MTRKLFITAKPNARDEMVEKIDDTHFVVAVKAPPIRGRANAAIIKALADYFHTASSRLRLVSGYTNKHKVVELTTVP